MTDDELRSILLTWEAPRAPETLRERVLRRRSRWIRWLVSGEIRVPVPLALAAAGLLLIIALAAVRDGGNSLSDFQQVHQFQPRIMRSVAHPPAAGNEQ